jgi:hypothetical protein
MQERQFEAPEERRQVFDGDWFGRAHKLFPSSNAPAAELLGEKLSRPGLTIPALAGPAKL